MTTLKPAPEVGGAFVSPRGTRHRITRLSDDWVATPCAGGVMRNVLEAGPYPYSRTCRVCFPPNGTTSERPMTTVESPVDRVLQVIRANFGDRLIIRIPADLDMDAIEEVQKGLVALNPGVKFVFIGCDHPVEPEPEFLERACEVLHDAYEHAAAGAGWVTNPASRKPWAEVPAENQATMRAAVTALWQWMTGG